MMNIEARRQELEAMVGRQLIAEAEKIGVKLSRKGNALKESRTSAAEKILKKEIELMEQVADVIEVVEEPVVETVEEAQTVEVEAEEVATEETVEEVTETVEEVPEAETEQTTEEVPAVEAETEQEVEVTKPAKKRGRTRTKKTFEELVADIPVTRNDITFSLTKKGEVRVNHGKKRIFQYTGNRVLVNDIALLDGIEYTEKTYGYKYFCAPTVANMKTIFANIKG